MKRRWKTWLGMALSLGLLILILTRVGWEELSQGFAAMDKAWIWPLVGLFAIGLFLRAWRWQCLLSPARAVSLIDCGNIILVGNLANNFLPAKGGDVARAVILSRKDDVRFLFSLTSVAVERIFDGLALLLIFQVTGSSVKLAPAYWGIMRDISVGAGVVFVGAFAGLLTIQAFPGIMGWLRRLAGQLPGKIGTKADQLLIGLQDSLFFIRLDLGFAGFVGLSVLVWAIEGLGIWVAFQAFAVPGTVMDSYFIFVITNFGGLLPSAPGNLGIYQASTVLSFSMLDLPMQAAVPLSIMVQSVQIIFNSILGLFSMRMLRLDFSFFLPSRQPRSI